MNPTKTVHPYLMYLCIIIYALLGINNLQAQGAFFIDSLYHYDLTGLAHKNEQLYNARVDYLKHNYGLSTGVTINNSEFNLYNNGVSSRIRLDMDVLGSGWLSNKYDKERIQVERAIEELAGNSEELNHNYGLYYDYILFLFNELKQPLIEGLIVQIKDLAFFQTELYYNKIITFDELLETRSDIAKYESLLEAVKNFNKVCASVYFQDGLPRPDDILTVLYHLDIDRLTKELTTDLYSLGKYDLKKDLVENKYRKKSLPRLSISTGFRIRDAGLNSGKMFFGLSFRKDILPSQDRMRDIEIDMVDHQEGVEQQQLQKEIATHYYEYQYKLKQHQTLQYKLYHYQEVARIHRVKNNQTVYLDGVEVKKNSIDSLMVSLEMIDLRQQLMLKILKLKKLIYPRTIGDYLEEVIDKDIQRYAGNRFYLLKENYLLTAIDLDILESNEIEVINTSDVLEMREIVLVPIVDFNSRLELEKWIEQKISKYPDRNFLFTDLAAFKGLEIKTMEQPALSWMDER